VNHFVKVLTFACAAALAVLFIGQGVHFHGPLAASLVLAVGTGFATLVAGVATLIGTRAAFKLSQSGRLIELGVFWLYGSLAFKALGHLASAWLTVTCAPLAGLLLLASVVALAFVTGNIGMFGNRSLLPQRRKDE
jgi:hypothetical protein